MTIITYLRPCKCVFVVVVKLAVSLISVCGVPQSYGPASLVRTVAQEHKVLRDSLPGTACFITTNFNLLAP